MSDRVLRPRPGRRIFEKLPSTKLASKRRTREVLSDVVTTPAATIVSSNAGLEDTSEPTQHVSRKRVKYVHRPGSTPFLDHKHPTPQECGEVERLLISAHGPSIRPQTMKVDNSVSGCGEVPSVLDALMRTILSANTSNANSARAFQGLVERYGLTTKEEELDESNEYQAIEKARRVGTGSIDWDAVRRAPVKDLYESIKCGGLANMKSKNMKAILDQVYEESSGSLTLDYLHDLSDEGVKKKLTSFKGVGVKTASCVLLFCLRRESFAVDTHIFRLAKFLGWVPQSSTRDMACYHLDTMIPPELKYSLHNLLIRHGRMCSHCRAGPERSAKSPPRPRKRRKEMSGGTPEFKKTRKIWVGNGMMKEMVIEVESDQEGGEVQEEYCVLESLMMRIRKPRKGGKVKTEEIEDQAVLDKDTTLDDATPDKDVTFDEDTALDEDTIPGDISPGRWTNSEDEVKFDKRI